MERSMYMKKEQYPPGNLACFPGRGRVYQNMFLNAADEIGESSSRTRRIVFLKNQIRQGKYDVPSFLLADRLIEQNAFH